MKIHHLRNATFVIESKEHYILIDPMLCGIGELPTFTYFKHKPKKNPLVPLPKNSAEILRKVNNCLITHSQKWGIELMTHIDHLDKPGKTFLIKNATATSSLKSDTQYLKKQGINITQELEYWNPEDFLGGKITAIPAKHGHGWMHYFMANGAGYYIELPDEPSLYISGDTVLTKEVKRALAELKPDITVVAAGNASLDLDGDILMPMDEIVEFIKLSPLKVIANHMEALNHCPITRIQLREELKKNDLSDKVYIPEDGETLHIPK